VATAITEIPAALNLDIAVHIGLSTDENRNRPLGTALGALRVIAAPRRHAAEVNARIAMVSNSKGDKLTTIGKGNTHLTQSGGFPWLCGAEESFILDIAVAIVS